MAWSGECVTEIDVATIRGIFCLIKNLIQPLPALIILAALIMLILAGLRMINAGGSDPKELGSAWQTFVWAILGIILLSVVWLVFVAIEKFTGAPVTKFGVP